MFTPSRPVVSHGSAARLWGVELIDDDGLEHVTVPRGASRRRVGAAVVHRADLPGRDVELTDEGTPVTTPTRTLLDLARSRPLAPAVAAADSALRSGLVTVEELRSAASGCRGRGSGRVRALARCVDPLAGSVLESLLRVLLVAAGLPAPLTQHVITSAGVFVARVDFCWPDARLVVEADGYAYHSRRSDYRRDRRRLNALESLGWRVLRFSWEDVCERPEEVVALVRTMLAS